MEPFERIVQKSIELFTQNGIRQVTMDQIADEVGMSKRTIYELFRDKDTLLQECLERIHQQHLVEIEEILSNASNVIEALYRFGQHGEKKKAAINRLFFEDIRKFYPGMWNDFTKKTKPGPGSLSFKMLQQGQDEGIFRQDINVEIVDIFIHYIMEAFHSRHIFPQHYNDKDILWNVIIPYYKGICTEKGQKLIDQHIPLLYSN